MRNSDAVSKLQHGDTTCDICLDPNECSYDSDAEDNVPVDKVV